MQPIDVIRSKLETLARRRREVGTAIERARSEFAEIDVQLKLLTSLHDEIVAITPAAPVTTTPEADEADDDLPGPTAAIVDLLERHPHGLPADQIVRMLEGQVKTTATDQRKLLQNTLVNLRTRGVIKFKRTMDGTTVYTLTRGAASAAAEAAEEEDDDVPF